MSRCVSEKIRDIRRIISTMRHGSSFDGKKKTIEVDVITVLMYCTNVLMAVLILIFDVFFWL